MTAANLITLVRTGMAFVAVLLLYDGSNRAILFAMVLIVLAIALDAVDGIVARRRQESSGAGAIMDIACDRLIESVMWIVFADLRVIGVWVPIVMVSRGVVVDAFRGAAYAQGMSAFGENSMMQSTAAKWLTGGRFMRAAYGGAKLIAFAFLAGLVGYEGSNPTAFSLYDLYRQEWFRFMGWLSVWSAVTLSLLRGLPVVLEPMLASRGESTVAADHLARLASRAELLDRDDAPALPEAPA